MKILSKKSIGGGCIGYTYIIETDKGKFFLKEYSIGGVSRAEAIGLSELKGIEKLKIPLVYSFDSNSLVLEYINEGHKNRNFYKDLGLIIGKLHKKTSTAFGLEIDNFIGSTPQLNSYNTSWPSFYINNRLYPQFKLAIDNGFKSLSLNLDDFLNRVLSILPKHITPSLVHGDLWSGNVMADSNGYPVLIDPAIYYGHCEVDIAMTKLFGGFPDDFYNSYYSIIKKEDDFSYREKIYNLYHLLNHLNIFGSSYLYEVEGIIKAFS